MRNSRIIILVLISFFATNSFAQIRIGDNDNIDYSNPKTYTIGGITLTGVQYLDNAALIRFTGLEVGQEILVPGEEIIDAINNLWDQGLFESVVFTATDIQGNMIFLNIHLEERARLSKFSFHGVKKSEADDLKDALNLTAGDPITDNLKYRIEDIVKDYFEDKGYINSTVEIQQNADVNGANKAILSIEIDKGERTRIANIQFEGNNNVEDKFLLRAMTETKKMSWVIFWKSSKLIDDLYKADKNALIKLYQSKGYRDARIISDTIYQFDEQNVAIDIEISEGDKYYFRDITWVGNTKYTDEQLTNILNIHSGDVYDYSLLETQLYMNMEGFDVSSLYLDDGYLFFNVTPVEVYVENDSIDIELQIYEGKKAVIGNVFVTGNTRTNDHVILREIRTKPGDVFSRSDITRTLRELATLQYFNQETLNVNPIPNPVDGTVDIEYIVEETSTDQIELSGGFGGGMVVGTLGLSFNNFSMSNLFNREAWAPLPSGDGQRFSIRGQTNGTYYQSYNASFTEPWLGGKKPNRLSTSIYYTMYSNGYDKESDEFGDMKILGASVGLGKRLKWPDDFFSIYADLSYQRYMLDNYDDIYLYSTGNSNNINLTLTLQRNSVDAPIYPRSGSSVMLSMSATPPYSYLYDPEVPYSDQTVQEKYDWLEYYKWKVNLSWFKNLAGDLVLNTRFKFGFLNYYNSEIGDVPFERFYLGGDGLTGYSLDGREVIGMRGYSNNSVTPLIGDEQVGGTIYNKYTVELRYPISLNPMATVYALAFVEAGNTWVGYDTFNPFDVKRAAGAGVRIYLPMFGLLGLDWGYGFDEVDGVTGAGGSQFHFSINSSID